MPETTNLKLGTKIVQFFETTKCFGKKIFFLLFILYK